MKETKDKFQRFLREFRETKSEDEASSDLLGDESAPYYMQRLDEVIDIVILLNREENVAFRFIHWKSRFL